MSSVIEVCFIYITSNSLLKKQVALCHTKKSNMIPNFVPSTTFKEPFEQIITVASTAELWLPWDWELRKGTIRCLLLRKDSWPHFLEWVPKVQRNGLFVSFYVLTRVNSCRCRMRLVLGISIRDELFLNDSILIWSVKSSHMSPALCYFFVTGRYNMH